MNRHLRLLLIASALYALFALGAASALAGYSYRSTFSGPGSGDGQLQTPGRAAAERSTGNLFVVDSGNDRVQVFKPNGSSGADYLTQFGGGDLSEPWGIAIDENGGQTSIYVADAGNDRIVKYSSDEAATPAFTIDPSFTSPSGSEVGDFRAALAVDPTTHDLLVADEAAGVIARFESDGDPISSFDGSAGTGSPGAFANPIDVAVNSAGDVYVVDATGNIKMNEGTSAVLRYSSAGSYKATLAPVGTHQAPATVAVDPVSGDVVASGDQENVYEEGPTPFAPVIAVFDSSNVLVETRKLDALGEFGEVLAQYDSVSGLAIAPGAPGRLYVALDVGTYFSSTYGSPRIQAFAETRPPKLVLDPVGPGDVTVTGAELSGTVDPSGQATESHFEYSSDNGKTWTPTATQNIGSGEGAVPVSVSLTILLPNSAYLLRLVATNADGSSTKQGSFATLASKPLVETLAAAGVTDTTGWLKARVNAAGEATTYYFEWGTDTSYGSTAPVSGPGSAGSGVTYNVLSQPLTGLQPGATYHYRVVATNSLGASQGADHQFTTGTPLSCPNQAIREAQGTQHLPECRAYEQVSPADKAGGTVAFPSGFGGRQGGQTSLQAVTPSGDRAVFTSFSAFGGSQHGTIGSYRSVRTPTGWSSAQWTPIPGVPHPDLSIQPQIQMASEDLSVGLMRTTSSYDPLDAEPFTPEAFDIYTVEPGKQPVWQSRPNTETPMTVPAPPLQGGMSADGKIVYYQAPEALTPETPGSIGPARWLYGRSNGVTTLVSAQTPGGAPVSACGAVAGRGMEGGADTEAGEPTQSEISTSADGRRIAFSAPDPAMYWYPDPACEELNRVFVLDEDEVLEASASQRSTPAPFTGARYQAISGDGSSVYLTSSAPLTDDAPVGQEDLLYRFDVDARHLTYIDSDVSTVPRTSADGNRAIYIRANGPDADLMLARVGQAPLVIASNFEGRASKLVLGARGATGGFMTNPSADTLLFQSTRNLTSFDSHGFTEIYRWSEGEPGFVCISCNREGRNPEGDASFQTDFSVAMPRTPPRHVTADGDTAFFQTTDSLADGDSNSDMDVYEWRDGEVRLISSGKSPSGSYFFDASADGSKVFFTTPENLLRSDIDNGDEDIYVAAVGGGFVEPDLPPGCAADSCQGEPPAAPAAAAIGSRTAQGANAKPGKSAKGCKAKAKGKGRKKAKCAKQGKAKSKTKARGRHNAGRGR